MAVDTEGRIVVSGAYSGSMRVGNRLLVTDVPENEDVVDSFLASFKAPLVDDTTPPDLGTAIDQTCAAPCPRAGEDHHRLGHGHGCAW
jgi:hypothetical protein